MTGSPTRIGLRIGGYAPRDSTHGRALGEIARSIEHATDGRIAVDVLWNVLDEGRPASSLLDMVETGDLSICYFSTSYLGPRVPLVNALDVPYLFSDLATAHRALDGAFGDALGTAIEEATGLMVLGYWDNGFRHLTNRLRPVRSPADLAGMRVRLQPNPVHAALIEAWGAIPVAVDLGEAIDLIRTGSVDAQENPLANTVAYGVDRVHHHATMTGHLYGARGVFGHPATIRGLSDHDRRVVEDAVRQAVTMQRRQAFEAEAALRTRLETGGMAFVDLDDDARTAFVEAAQPVIDRAVDEHGGDIFDLARV